MYKHVYKNPFFAILVLIFSSSAGYQLFKLYVKG